MGYLEIFLVIIEGVKKVGVLFMAGYGAIVLLGVYNGYCIFRDD